MSSSSTSGHLKLGGQRSQGGQCLRLCRGGGGQALCVGHTVLVDELQPSCSPKGPPCQQWARCVFLEGGGERLCGCLLMMCVWAAVF